MASNAESQYVSAQHHSIPEIIVAIEIVMVLILVLKMILGTLFVYCTCDFFSNSIAQVIHNEIMK